MVSPSILDKALVSASDAETIAVCRAGAGPVHESCFEHCLHIHIVQCTYLHYSHHQKRRTKLIIMIIVVIKSSEENSISVSPWLPSPIRSSPLGPPAQWQPSTSSSSSQTVSTIHIINIITFFRTIPSFETSVSIIFLRAKNESCHRRVQIVQIVRITEQKDLGRWQLGGVRNWQPAGVSKTGIFCSAAHPSLLQKENLIQMVPRVEKMKNVRGLLKTRNLRG